MRLDQALVERGLAPSRARAQALIREGLVSVDGAPADKANRKVRVESDLQVDPCAHDYVSRAALKLEAGLDRFAVDPEGRTCLDLGASTGGFTEILLRRSAAKVFAVDVGRDQLHPTLRADPRVISLEGTHAKALTSDLITEPPSLLVCDVSFISLKKALPVPLSLTAPGAELVTLVKPQFELGPEAIGKNGRVIWPEDEQKACLGEAVIGFLESSGWRCGPLIDSPILGGDGTKEFLLHAQKAA